MDRIGNVLLPEPHMIHRHVRLAKYLQSEIWKTRKIEKEVCHLETSIRFGSQCKLLAMIHARSWGNMAQIAPQLKQTLTRFVPHTGECEEIYQFYQILSKWEKSTESGRLLGILSK